MASRAQQVYAGQRKFGHAMSIVSVLQNNEQGTKEYQQWKDHEKKLNKKGNEQIEQELFQVKKQRCRIMATIFRYQQGRLTLRRILDLYPIAWIRCAKFYQDSLHTKINKKVLQIKIHLVIIQLQRCWRRKKILQIFLNDVSSNKIRRWWRVWHQIRFRRLYKEGTRINHWLRHLYQTYEAKNVIVESQKKKKVARFMAKMLSSNNNFLQKVVWATWKRHYEAVMYEKYLGGQLEGYASSLTDLQAQMEDLEKNDPTKISCVGVVFCFFVFFVLFFVLTFLF